MKKYICNKNVYSKIELLFNYEQYSFFLNIFDLLYILGLTDTSKSRVKVLSVEEIGNKIQLESGNPNPLYTCKQDDIPNKPVTKAKVIKYIESSSPPKKKFKIVSHTESFFGADPLDPNLPRAPVKCGSCGILYERQKHVEHKITCQGKKKDIKYGCVHCNFMDSDMTQVRTHIIEKHRL